MCNSLYSYTPRHQFLAEMPEAKVSCLFCIGRLVSKTENAMRLANQCRHVSMKRFICDAMDTGYTKDISIFFSGQRFFKFHFNSVLFNYSLHYTLTYLIFACIAQSNLRSPVLKSANTIIFNQLKYVRWMY